MDTKKKKEKTQEEFLDAYRKLCTEYGYDLVAVPSFVQDRLGTFSIAINFKVQRV